MSSRKSYFLWAEYARMAELERRVESARRESQERVAEVRAEGQRAAKRATAIEQGLEATKARQGETEARLRASLASTKAELQVALAALEPEQSALASERVALKSARKALEVEQRARSEADQEVLTLRGRVMETEEFPQPVSELVALLPELGETVKTLEQDLETTKATVSRNAEELAKAREERHALEGDLDQIHSVAQLVVSEIFMSVPSTSAPAVQLVEVPDVVKDLELGRNFVDPIPLDVLPAVAETGDRLAGTSAIIVVGASELPGEVVDSAVPEVTVAVASGPSEGLAPASLEVALVVPSLPQPASPSPSLASGDPSFSGDMVQQFDATHRLSELTAA
ncbi:uncharacterized protein [Miscanthus floridulus]|uniref:uncharacterized protein n=1 Tax=Miscanthus floridulus TaxID=154761 RepID=UPI00345AAACC